MIDKWTLTLGHSPDPDDAFMFYGLAEELIPTHGFRFEHILQDIQTLNERALQGSGGGNVAQSGTLLFRRMAFGKP